MSWISRRWAGWFDGTDDYVNCGNISSTDKITIEIYFSPRYIDGELTLICKNNSYRVFVRLDDAYGHNIWTDFWDSSDGTKYRKVVAQNPNMTAQKRYHVVVTFGDGYRRIYQDGVKLAEWAEDFTIQDLGNNLIVGKVASATGQYFGDIYLVRIYNRVLTDSEIAKLNEDPFNPDNVPRGGLVGWWDFNKADWENGVLPDLSGNGNDGVIHGVVQRDVLVKRGTGDLPQYDLLYSWVCDGIDDYVIVDLNGYTLTREITVSLWESTHNGRFPLIFVKNYAPGSVGHYDSAEDAWRVDVGERGYFMEYVMDYTESSFGKGVHFFVDDVKVDDALDVPLMRLEVYDGTGKLIHSHEYMANNFPTDTYSGLVSGGVVYVPYGGYKIRMYSYGNVGFWIRIVKPEAYHTHLVNSSVFRVYRRGYAGELLVWKTNGSYGVMSFGGCNYRLLENITVSWSLVAQRFRLYVNGSFAKEQSEISGIDAKIGTTANLGGSGNLIDGWTGEFVSVMLFDRELSDNEVSDIYNKRFVLDGLVHWWVVDGNGNLVDLVSGKSYEIQGNPYIRRIHDDEGRLNSGIGGVVFDLIVEERGR